MTNRTWASSPASGAYYGTGNWVGGVPPDGPDTATFGTSTNKAVLISDVVLVQGWNVNSTGYAFTVNSGISVLFFGAGITDTSTNRAAIANAGTISFLGSSTAGSTKFTGPGDVNFAISANAGLSRFELTGKVLFENTTSAYRATFDMTGSSSLLEFSDTSTADGADINVAGTLRFKDQSTAAVARISTDGRIEFEDQSTAASATIQVLNAVYFKDGSHAADATIQGKSFVVFQDDSVADTAQISTTSTVRFEGNSSAAGSEIEARNAEFSGHATAGNAQISAQFVSFEDNASPGNATFNVSHAAEFGDALGPNGDHKIAIAAIFGEGDFNVGSNVVTVGINDASSYFQGSLRDGTRGQGGSLVKVGAGNFVLTYYADHTGGTTINAGGFQVNGLLNGDIAVNGGRLGGSSSGQIAGVVTVNAGGTFGPGNSDALYQNADTLTMYGTVNFKPGSAFAIDLGGIVAGAQHDALVVNGKVSIEGAQLNASLIDNFSPSRKAHQTFVIVENNKKDAIDGHFAGLAQGAALAAGNRIFSINYKGGTGNDIVLTSEGVLVTGTAGKDTISTTKAPAGEQKATQFRDKILGQGGNDKVTAAGGDDTVRGGAGKDVIDGGKGTDTADYSDKTKSVSVTLNGSSAVSVRVDGKAEDSIRNVENLVGGRKADSFIGDSKANSFDGGRGKDIFTGRDGSDKFVFSAALSGANADKITDFSHKHDKIVLDTAIFAAIGPELAKGEFYAKAGAKQGHDDSDRIIYNKSNGNLYYDADGEGGAKAVLFATLTNHLGNLGHGDFAII